jgi:hypothetical protein
MAQHTQLDLDPLRHSDRKAWWLLYPGQTATVQFDGTRLAILTMIGPDSGTVTCEVQTLQQTEHPPTAHGPPRTPLDKKTPAPHTSADSHGPARSTRRPLLDKWSYFWRVAVVMLAEGLPPGRHVARVGLEPIKPDPAIMKRPPAGAEWERCVAEGKDHKLWLMYWLVGD